MIIIVQFCKNTSDKTFRNAISPLRPLINHRDKQNLTPSATSVTYVSVNFRPDIKTILTKQRSCTSLLKTQQDNKTQLKTICKVAPAYLVQWDIVE